MTPTDIIPLTRIPLADALALNNANAHETSWLDAAKWTRMLRTACHATGLPDAAAMLIAFDQTADYDGGHFLWFRSRYPRFVYIDRVITAAPARGRGCARALYHDLFAKAARDGHQIITCEVNFAPPNPVSDAFHANLGFAEVGRAALDGNKTVRYLTRPIAPAPR